MLIALIILLGILAIGALLAENFEAFIVLLIAFFAALLYQDATSGAWKARVEQQNEADRRAAIPHVIREADGCKVYAFTTDREHYFTRCGSSVTTETNWSKSCGKSCTKHESDTITTEGNK